MTDATAKMPPIDGPITHTHIGGQAVLEGIMMRGRYNWAVAVRTPDGSIHFEEHDLESGKAKKSWMRWPIVRGCVAMVETLSLAMKAFSVSASLAGETEEEQLSAKEISITMVLGAGLAILFFIVLPAVLTTYGFRIKATEQPFAWNIVDGILRVVAFFGYIWAIGRMEDIKRVFGYHGAEHKTIHAYEHNLPLEPDLIQRYETLHVRCGTSFLLMVMILAILVFSLVPVRLIAENLGVTSRDRHHHDRHPRPADPAAARRGPRLRGHREVGRQPFDQPVREGPPVAGDAAAAHDHPRADRRHGRGRRGGDGSDHRPRGARGAHRQG